MSNELYHNSGFQALFDWGLYCYAHGDKPDIYLNICRRLGLNGGMTENQVDISLQYIGMIGKTLDELSPDWRTSFRKQS